MKRTSKDEFCTQRHENPVVQADSGAAASSIGPLKDNYFRMNTAKTIALKELQQIPGIGKSVVHDLYNIGIRNINDLKGKDPEKLYHASNQFAGAVQDKCLLYVFRCAVYFAETILTERDPEKLKWWNWK